MFGYVNRKYERKGGMFACLLACSAVALSASTSKAVNIYYDTNAATAGTGASPQDWNSGNAVWTTDPTGATATVSWPATGAASLDGSDVYFSAGTNAPAAYVLNLAGNKVCNSINVQQGALTLRTIGASAANRTIGVGGINVMASSTATGVSAVGNFAINASTGTAGILTTVLGASQTWTDSNATATLGVTTPITSNATVGNTYTLTTAPNGLGDVTVGGIIGDGAGGGNVAITATGLGTVAGTNGRTVLTGANTYTGTTTVKSGTLFVAAAAQTPLLTGIGGTDIQGGKLQLDYTGGITPVVQVQTILNNEYATNGNFATGEIRGTTLAAGQTIGYTDDTTNSNVTLRVTLPGDANLDGVVNFSDFLLLQASFGGTGTTFGQGNFNYDGATNFSDFLLLQSNFGSSINGTAVTVTSSEIAAMNAFAASVPEPASLALCGLGAVALLKRKRTA